MRPFRLVQDHSWLGGVCGGLAYALGLPAWLLRILLVVALFGYGVSFWPYVLLWVFVPNWHEDPLDYEWVTGD